MRMINVATVLKLVDFLPRSVSLQMHVLKASLKIKWKNKP